MPPAEFEHAIPAGERPQSYALDRAATAIGRNRTQNPTTRAAADPRPLESAVHPILYHCHSIHVCNVAAHAAVNVMVAAFWYVLPCGLVDG